MIRVILSCLSLFTLLSSLYSYAETLPFENGGMVCGSYLEKDDVLSRYYDDMREGRTVDLKRNVFSEHGLVTGVNLNEQYLTLTPKAFADDILTKLHQHGFVERETCRVSNTDYVNDLSVVVSRYMNFFPDTPNEITYGIKVVTINRKANRITTMSWKDLGKIKL